ncbi:MAG TPA: DNA-3-methyladenine glycosylase [Coxiellaceae bacterium]|nr:DNA-3-methyladenine glycosylase [Coxiellaceae bacterium]
MLPNSFFNRDAQVVAKSLLGKVLRVKYKNHWLAAQIIETEAYYRREKASHSSLGHTESRRAMFMPAGTIYMYYCRGADTLNVSVRGAGNAVLIKAGIPFEDEGTSPQMISLMQSLNPHKTRLEPRDPLKLCKGQTLLCKSLNLKVKEWDKKAFDLRAFYIEEVEYRPSRIIQTTRLGIAPERDAHLPYRFIDAIYLAYCTKVPSSSLIMG